MLRPSVPSLDGVQEIALRTKIRSASRVIPSYYQWRVFIGSLIINDAVMMFLAFRLAYITRFKLAIPIFRLDVVPPEPFYTSLMLFLVPLWLGIFYLLSLYNRQYLLGGIEEYSRVFRAITASMLLVIIAGFLRPEFIIARGWLILSWGFAFFGTSLGRFLLRRVIYALREHGYFLSMALIVGANAEGRSLADQLRRWRKSGLYILGFVDNKSEVTTPVLHFPPILGSINNIDEIITQNGVEELILATSALSRDEILSIFNRYGVSSEVNLRLSSGLYEIITTGLQVKEMAFVPLVVVNKVRLTGLDRVMKLIMDYGLTIPGAVLVSPLLLALGCLVKLDSPGPVLHRRKVMGVNGKQFEAFKFRTMYINGEEILSHYPQLQTELARNQKLKDDPRITRIGKFLRRFSLDELPQIFNVLKHDMSLVGPRMISPEEMKLYNQWGLNLLTVRPGITGLWQVSGRSDVLYEQRVQLDMQYIRNWSIWLDIQILIRTIPVVIKGKGAY